MVFDKNVEIRIIEEFENDCLEKVSRSANFMLLKRELLKKNLRYEIGIHHTQPDLKKYCSHIVIDIFNNKGERVCEYDEPSCCLMLCEPVCYMRGKNIVGINLLTDKEFLESLKLLIEQVKKVYKFEM